MSNTSITLCMAMITGLLFVFIGVMLLWGVAPALIVLGLGVMLTSVIVTITELFILELTNRTRDLKG